MLSKWETRLGGAREFMWTHSHCYGSIWEGRSQYYGINARQ